MTDDIKVTDAEALAWTANLSEADKQELKRRALEKRAIEMAQPEKEIDWGSLSEGDFQAAKRKLGIG